MTALALCVAISRTNDYALAHSLSVALEEARLSTDNKHLCGDGGDLLSSVVIKACSTAGLGDASELSGYECVAVVSSPAASNGRSVSSPCGPVYHWLLAQQRPNVDEAVMAMRLGAVDVLDSRPNVGLPQRLQNSIRRVRAAVAQSGDVVEFSKRLTKLSPRLTLVLDRLLEGRTSKEIAREMSLSTRTVEDYRAEIVRKLGVATFAELLIKTSKVRSRL